VKVIFANENTLGHTSYLPVFAAEFSRRPELGVEPLIVNATPLPPRLRWWGDPTVPLLRRWGLDLAFVRWRLAVSRNVRTQIDELRRRGRIDVIVANTQSVALSLADHARELPLFVCLDATFEELARTPWFAPSRAGRALLHLNMLPLRRRERRLFAAADRLLPWSERVCGSLREDYGISGERVWVLPPSIKSPPARQPRTQVRPQILFIGSAFERKGGPLVLECFRRHFVDRCDLHLVTRSHVPEERGVIVHRGITAGSEAWLRRWTEADVFVFPSQMETFGIVLLEALAFMVPVISSPAGAARNILDEGKAGWLLQHVTPEGLAVALREALDRPDEARRRAEHGRRWFETHFELASNSVRLMNEFQTAIERRRR
jgi:glycosyltransferase involved in cell wall biosynthesis